MKPNKCSRLQSPFEAFEGFEKENEGGFEGFEGEEGFEAFETEAGRGFVDPSKASKAFGPLHLRELKRPCNVLEQTPQNGLAFGWLLPPSADPHLKLFEIDKLFLNFPVTPNSQKMHVKTEFIFRLDSKTKAVIRVYKDRRGG